MIQNEEPKITRIISIKWDEVIRLAERMHYGEIIIKVHEKKVDIVEYTVKRKPLQGPDADIEITPLN